MSSLDELKQQFTLVTKRIIKQNLTRNINKHREYIRDLVSAYNNIIGFVNALYFPALSEHEKQEYKRQLSYFRDRFQECLSRLGIEAELASNLLSVYEVEPFLALLDELNKSNQNASYYNTASDTENSNTDSSDSETPSTSKNTNSKQKKGETKNNNVVKMPDAMTIPEFMRLSAQTINKNYSGDPIALDAFIDSIELLELAATDNLKPTLIRFVLAKLEGRARESVPQNCNDINIIKEALRDKIKPDSSKVIAGRMMALRMDQKKMQDFSQQAEELSEAFRRSLIGEGITQDKASEMAIDKAIDMCRASARSDLVKSVLASSQFKDTKEVIAKLIVETATDTTERQILAYQKHNNNRSKQNYRGNSRNYNNNHNNRNNNNQNNNNNYRGRGRGRGRGRYNNNRNNNYRNNYNNNNNNASVRYVETDQEQISLGFHNTTQQQTNT